MVGIASRARTERGENTTLVQSHTPPSFLQRAAEAGFDGRCPPGPRVRRVCRAAAFRALGGAGNQIPGKMIKICPQWLRIKCCCWGTNQTPEVGSRFCPPPGTSGGGTESDRNPISVARQKAGQQVPLMVVSVTRAGGGGNEMCHLLGQLLVHLPSTMYQST